MYPITTTVTITNAAQLAALNSFLLGVDAPAAAAPAKEAEVKKPPKAEAASAAQPAATPATQEQTAAPAGDSKPRTIDEAKALTMKMVAAKGRDAAVAVLTKYEVKVAAALKPEQIAPFCAEVEKALAS